MPSVEFRDNVSARLRNEYYYSRLVGYYNSEFLGDYTVRDGLPTYWGRRRQTQNEDGDALERIRNMGT